MLRGDQPARRPADANNSLPRLSRSRFSSCLCRRAHGNATAPLTERLDVGRSTPRASCPSYIDLPAAEGRIDPRFCWDAVTILQRLSADTYLVAGPCRPDYPYLSGPKIGPLWLRRLSDNAGPSIQRFGRSANSRRFSHCTCLVGDRNRPG